MFILETCCCDWFFGWLSLRFFVISLWFPGVGFVGDFGEHASEALCAEEYVVCVTSEECAEGDIGGLLFSWMDGWMDGMQ